MRSVAWLTPTNRRCSGRPGGGAICKGSTACGEPLGIVLPTALLFRPGAFGLVNSLRAVTVIAPILAVVVTALGIQSAGMGLRTATYESQAHPGPHPQFRYSHVAPPACLSTSITHGREETRKDARGAITTQPAIRHSLA